MVYKDKSGRAWRLKLNIEKAEEVLEVWGIDLLNVKTASLSLSDALKVADTLVGYDDSFFSNIDDDIKKAVEVELIYFFLPPDYERGKKKKTDDKEERLTFSKLYELGGAVGVDPRPLTLWQLVALFNGAQKRDWGPTSSILSLLYNINRGKGRARTPADFNPTIKAQKLSETAPSIDTVLFREAK